jgi:hypothetical protein
LADGQHTKIAWLQLYCPPDVDDPALLPGKKFAPPPPV